MNFYKNIVVKKMFLLLLAFTIILVSFQHVYYLPPLGGDEYLTIWPFRRIIFSEDFKLVFKDFGNNYFYEDHISPFFTLFASFLPFDFFHPTTHIKLLNLIAFYIGLIFLYFIASKYFQDKYFLAIFFIFFLSNKTLIHQHLSYYYSYTIILSLQLINFYFLLKLINKFTFKNYIIYFLFGFIGTLTYENFFLYYFFESAFLCFYYLDEFKKDNFFKLFLIGFKSFTCLTIYFILHKIKYDTFIFSYSSPSFENLLDYLIHLIRLTLQLTDDILFGLIYLVYYPPLQVILILFTFYYFIFLIRRSIKKQKFSKEKKGLLYAILFCYLGILYTGRYDPGLWTFFTFLVYLFLFLLLTEELKKLKKSKI